MDESGDAIISIRPNFAEAILSGMKTVELRRRIPSIELGTRLWIYATRPTAAVVGSVILERMIRGTPVEVWALCGQQTGVDRATYDAYFGGTNVALGLVLADVQRRNPIEIEQLRELRDGFHPPQVIAKLTKEETNSLFLLSRAA